MHFCLLFRTLRKKGNDSLMDAAAGDSDALGGADTSEAPPFSLFEALVSSDTSPLSIMKECTEEELASNLRFVCDMPTATPLWLDWHRRMAMQTLNEVSEGVSLMLDA